MSENLSYDFLADDFSLDGSTLDRLEKTPKRPYQSIANDELENKENSPTPAQQFLTLLSQKVNAGSSADRQTSPAKRAFRTESFADTLSTKSLHTQLATGSVDSQTFFGLPMWVRDSIYRFKGITNLYDWQTECLSSEAVRKHHNLIYMSPTSGGKTLVAEILAFREIKVLKKNVIFVIPYVSIVQEKVQDMAQFAVHLGFRVEEYAGTSGELPPRKLVYGRNCCYIATIEKANYLVDSLIDCKRLHEIGLVIVDELHMLGEHGRGAVLEMLLTKLRFVRPQVQIVGMSATIGNLDELAKFLQAETYENRQRPTKLLEFIKIGPDVLSVERFLSGEPKLKFQKASSLQTMNEIDALIQLVLPELPHASLLIFCPTKAACELLAVKLAEKCPKTLVEYRRADKLLMLEDLSEESELTPELRQLIMTGIVYHHSGLTNDERKIIEDGYRDGALSVICSTSTLAAGVNLPAKKVIIRKPYVGRNFLTVAQYKQMIGRAGRAGYNEIGQSLLIVEPKDLNQVRQLLTAPVTSVCSQLASRSFITTFITDCIYIKIANTRQCLRSILDCSLLAVQNEHLNVNIKTLIDQTIELLVQTNMLSGARTSDTETYFDESLLLIEKRATETETIYDRSTVLELTKFGEACVKASFDSYLGQLVQEDIREAKKKLVLIDDLHPLYLLIPHSSVASIESSLKMYDRLTTLSETLRNLSESERTVANALGITMNLIPRIPTLNLDVKHRKLFTRITRFYLALIMNRYVKRESLKQLARTYQIDCGFLQNLVRDTIAYSFNVRKFCEYLDPSLGTFLNIFDTIHTKLKYERNDEMWKILLLPNVKKARAKMLINAGYTQLRSIAEAEPHDIVAKVKNISIRVAEQLVASAKIILENRGEDFVESVRNEYFKNIENL